MAEDKYILLSQALDVLDRRACWWAHTTMEEIPAADVAPVRHGKWSVYDIYEYKLADRTTAYEPVFACSACGMHTESYVREDYPQMPEDADFPKYCPHCGAKMDGDE